MSCLCVDSTPGYQGLRGVAAGTTQRDSTDNVGYCPGNGGYYPGYSGSKARGRSGMSLVCCAFIPLEVLFRQRKLDMDDNRVQIAESKAAAEPQATATGS